ncbi:MAG: hypothetical protein Q8N10_02690 [Phenylobacterium sp.]|uniref:hypothetical protein n=1 Tax=Phenylobacterium sp. TaxID=1871053 RepID=UPI0027206A8A|nr:hypothetical protein [Phenylobacterium sp.]MDO8911581.1 hypothetical protein [Phenylobacterium sp.]MDP3099389.1 hypothetical protein [Phenylobacterium sp.]
MIAIVEGKRPTLSRPHARLYPVLKELGLRRGANLPVKSTRSRLGWRRMREGHLDQVGLCWSNSYDGRFVIEWMTTDPRVVADRLRRLDEWADLSWTAAMVRPE